MLTEIRTDAALFALAPAWEALWRQARASPFQSPAWLLPWWAAFGTGQPRVTALWDGARLAGVLPLYVLADPAPRLLMIGVGITDYLDALLAPDAPRDAAGRMVDAALRSAALDGIACCDLTDLAPGAALRLARAPAGWRTTMSETDPCPILSLRGPDLRAVVPAAVHRKLRMNRNRAERAGGVSTDVASGETLAGYMDALIALHEDRWDGGVLNDPAVLDFHRRASPGLLAADMLRLHALKLGDQIIAAAMALHAGPAIAFYLSGYDRGYAEFSPGNLLLAAMLEGALAEGRTEAHFLRGGEAYKYAWGAIDRRNATLRLTANP